MSEELEKIDKTINNLLPDARYSLRTRAITRFGVKSDWSEALDFHVPDSDLLPTKPAPPLLFGGNFLRIDVTHFLAKHGSDFLFDLESNISHLEVHADTRADFVPRLSSKLGTITANQAHIRSQTPVFEHFTVEQSGDHWVNVLVVSRFGKRSEPSDPAYVNVPPVRLVEFLPELGDVRDNVVPGKGNLLVGNGFEWIDLPPGENYDYLIVDLSHESGLKWIKALSHINTEDDYNLVTPNVGHINFRNDLRAEDEDGIRTSVDVIRKGQLIILSGNTTVAVGGEDLYWNAAHQKIGFEDTPIETSEVTLPETAVYGIEGVLNWTDGYVLGGEVQLRLNDSPLMGLAPLYTGHANDGLIGRTFSMAEELIGEKDDKLTIRINSRDNVDPHTLHSRITVGLKETVELPVPTMPPTVPYVYGVNSFNLVSNRTCHGVLRPEYKAGDLLVVKGDFLALNSNGSLSSLTAISGWTFLDTLTYHARWNSMVAVKIMTPSMEVSTLTATPVVTISNHGGGNNQGMTRAISIHAYPGGMIANVTGHAGEYPGTDWYETLPVFGNGLFTSQVSHTYATSVGTPVPNPIGVNEWQIFRSGNANNTSGIHRSTVQRAFSPQTDRDAFAVGGSGPGFGTVTTAAIWRVR